MPLFNNSWPKPFQCITKRYLHWLSAAKFRRVVVSCNIRRMNPNKLECDRVEGLASLCHWIAEAGNDSLSWPSMCFRQNFATTSATLYVCLSLVTSVTKPRIYLHTSNSNWNMYTGLETWIQFSFVQARWSANRMELINQVPFGVRGWDSSYPFCDRRLSVSE